jgi:hypothetical protein
MRRVLVDGAEEPEFSLSTQLFHLSVTGTYDPLTRTFPASWNGGDYSDAEMTVRLNQAGDRLEYIYARQTQAAIGG